MRHWRKEHDGKRERGEGAQRGEDRIGNNPRGTSRIPANQREERMPEETASDPTRLGPVYSGPAGERRASSDSEEYFPEDTPTGLRTGAENHPSKRSSH
jgi:hypothetical protein